MKDKFIFNYLSGNKWFWLTFYFFVLSVVVSRNIGNKGIGHEEAGQFWMAKGLNHFSDLSEPDGNISQLIYNNRNFNLDPGGFTLLLRFWTALFGNSIFSLRLLPLVFLIISALVFRKILMALYFNSWIFNLSPLLLLLSKDLISFGFTVRAYSMEICGMILSIYFLNRFILLKNNRDLLYLFLTLAIFAHSRYGFLINISACLTMFFAYNFKSPGRLLKNRSFISGTILLVFSVAIIYWLYMRYHLQWTAFHGPDYSYVKTFKAQTSFKNGLELFLRNLTVIRIIPFSLMGVFVIAGMFSKRIPSFKKYGMLINYLLVYTIIAVILSFLGLYPWDVNSRNSLPFQFFSILAVCILMDWACQFLKNELILMMNCVLMPVIIFLSFTRGYIQYDFSYLTYKEGKNSMQTWVDWMIYPVLKYNICYGTLKNYKELHYPDPSKDKFNANYKYLVIDMEPRYKKACLERYGIKKYKVLKHIENDYLIEIIK